MLVCGFITAAIAERKGYAPKSWFWLGAMLGVIGTFILIIQPNKASAHDAKTNDATDPL
jgi:hypothetical protein